MRSWDWKGLNLGKGARKRTRLLAWKLKKNPTKAEARLWTYIKDSKLGVEFKPQVVIRGWIADFWCPEKGVVVEVDGSSHEGREEADAFRDFIMSLLDIIVVRVTNEEVFTNMRGALKKIRRALKA